MTKAKNCGRAGGAKANKVFSDQNTKKSWWKQGFIMVHADSLVAPLRQDPRQSEFIKKIRIADIKSDNGDLINKLTTNAAVLSFFDGTPIDYSQLVPYIEIRKVYVKSKKHVEEFTFPFDTHEDISHWNDARKGSTLFRGRSAGIQNIQVKMEGRGRNPVSANIMKLRIKLYFNDVQTLFMPLGVDKNNNNITYSDLIRYPPALENSKAKIKGTNASFRLRLILGWSVNPDNKLFKENKAFLKAVEQSRVSIMADMYTHEMDFNADGSLTLDISAMGALESTFSSSESNIMQNIDSNTIDIQRLKRNIANREDDLISGNKGTKDKLDNLVNIRKQIAEIREIQKKLDKSFTSASPYTKVDEAAFSTALANLQSSYQTANDLYGKQNPFKALKQESKTLGIADHGNNEQQIFKEIQARNKIINNNIRYNKRKIEAERRSLEKFAMKGLSKSAKNTYLKDIKKLKKTLKEYTSSIRGKHIFEYVEYMRQRGQLAWVLTGKKSKFGRYQDLIEAIDTGAGTKKGAKKIKKEVEKQIEEQNKSQEAADNEKKGKKPPAAPGNEHDEIKSPPLKEPKLAQKTTYEKKPLSEQAAKSLAKVKEEMFARKKRRRRRRRGGRSKKSKYEPTLWEAGNSPKYSKGTKLFFFTLGDLLSAILEKNNFGIKLEEQSPNFRLLLGEYDIPRSTKGGETQFIRMSLYDMPISLEIFHTFVAQKIVGSGRASYSLLQFLFDLVKFVMDKLQGVFGKAAEHAPASLVPVSFKMDLTSVDLPTDQIPKKSKNSKIVDANKNTEPDPNIITVGGPNSINTYNIDHFEKSAISNTTNSFVIHAKRRYKAGEGTSYKGDINEDASRGIVHFFVGGPNRGILKKINFSQSKNSLFETSLMRNGQSFGDEAANGIIKPSKFTCEVTLVGNPFFFIGQLFYVNTELISSGHFNKEGIMNGGYYVVTSVDSVFTADKWETKIRGVLNIPDSAFRSKKEYIAIMPFRRHPDYEKIVKWQEDNKQETSDAVKTTGRSKMLRKRLISY